MKTLKTKINYNPLSILDWNYCPNCDLEMPHETIGYKDYKCLECGCKH